MTFSGDLSHWLQELEKSENATAIVTSGTEMLSSTISVMGRDSTTVATKEIKATLGTVLAQSNCTCPKTE